MARFKLPTLHVEEAPAFACSYRADGNGMQFKGYDIDTTGVRTEDGEHIKIEESDIRILKALGRGASSTVHKGFLKKENKFVAVKKINVLERDTRHQMLNDMRALCQGPVVPGLIQFYGAYCVPEDGQICIVLEYMDGGSIADVLNKVKRIPENILSKIMAETLVGLMHLHKRHLVHRDIKPANILINTEGEPKITDFGISKAMDHTLAMCNTFLGTVTYMSPERINGESGGGYSFPADIWSIGLLAVECATGKYPYDATGGPLQLMFQMMERSPIPQGPEYSEEFRDFLRLCLQEDPWKRAPAEQLLQHPWIQMYANDPATIKDFMQCAFDHQDKLDEIAIVFATNFYALISAGPDRLNDLAPLYSQNSVLTLDGETVKGRADIITKLKEMARMCHVFGRATYEVVHVDCQSLGMDGSALVHVHGKITLKSMAASKPGLFAESFILTQARPGEYYVANQTFRLLTGRLA